MASYDASIKIMLLGDESVEKTSLTIRCISGFFLEDLKLTIGVDFYSKTINIDNKKIKVQIWDFGGEQRFRFLLHQYCKGANAAFFLYDITNRLSLDHLPDWTQIIREHAGDIPIILLGAKAHLKELRAVSKEEGILAAKKYNLSGFIEVSSKTGQNVEKAFEALTRLVLIQPQFCQKCKKEFTFEEFIKHPCYKAGEVLSTGRPSSYIPQIQGSYVPQTNISKKEKKKLAKEKKREQKEKAKPERIKKIVENREKQEKLIEDMKELYDLKTKKVKEFTNSNLPIPSRSELLQEIALDIIKKNSIINEYGLTKENICDPESSNQEVSSINLLINNLVSTIQKNPSKKVFHLRLFLDKFKDISDQDKNVVIQSIKDEDSEGLKEKILSILKVFKLEGCLKKKSDEDDDDDDRFPYPYIFTHPRPPDDFATAAQVQVRAPLKEKDSEDESNCQYCGMKLTKEEQFTHSCKKKPKNT